MNRIHRKLDDAVDDLRNGDLLLFRRRGLISIYGRGPYSHAAMFARWGGEPMAVESREFCGARAVTLRSEVEARPGRIDAFSVRDFYSHKMSTADRMVLVSRGDLAVQAAVKKLGNPYGYLSVLKCALLHWPGLRFINQEQNDDRGRAGRGEHCSEFFSAAWRAAVGIDPVPNLADWATEPNDLGRSDRFAGKDLFTLIP